MKASLLATSLLFGLSAAGISVTAQAAPLGVTNLSFAAPVQSDVQNDLLVRIVDRSNLASDGGVSRFDGQSRRFTRRSNGSSGSFNRFQGSSQPGIVQNGFGANRFQGQSRRFTRPNNQGIVRVLPSTGTTGIVRSQGANRFQGQSRRFTRPGNSGSINLGSFNLFGGGSILGLKPTPTPSIGANKFLGQSNRFTRPSQTTTGIVRGATRGIVRSQGANRFQGQSRRFTRPGNSGSINLGSFNLFGGGSVLSLTPTPTPSIGANKFLGQSNRFTRPNTGAVRLLPNTGVVRSQGANRFLGQSRRFTGSN